MGRFGLLMDKICTVLKEQGELSQLMGRDHGMLAPRIQIGGFEPLGSPPRPRA